MPSESIILLSNFFVLLIPTILIELGVAWLWKLRDKFSLFTIIFVNVFSYTIFFTLFTIITMVPWLDWTYGLKVTTLEIMVLIIEWQLLKFALVKTKKYFFLALVMNLASFILGQLIFTSYPY